MWPYKLLKFQLLIIFFIWDSDEPNTFLKFSQKIKDNSGELVNVEYHVVYSISYQVPMMFFQAHRSGIHNGLRTC